MVEDWKMFVSSPKRSVCLVNNEGRGATGDVEQTSYTRIKWILEGQRRSH